MLPRSYEAQWWKKNENSAIPKIKYELTVSKGTSGIRTHDTFLIFSSRDVTTANVNQQCLPSNITRNWQHKKLPTILRKISEQFFSIRQRQDNWDDCGSVKPNKLSISHAEGIIADLLNSVIDSGFLWITPFISSDEDGNITLEWHKGQHELHIEVREDEAEYIKVWGANIENEMHLDFLDEYRYLTLWDWLLHG